MKSYSQCSDRGWPFSNTATSSLYNSSQQKKKKPLSGCCSRHFTLKTLPPDWFLFDTTFLSRLLSTPWVSSSYEPDDCKITAMTYSARKPKLPEAHRKPQNVRHNERQPLSRFRKSVRDYPGYLPRAGPTKRQSTDRSHPSTTVPLLSRKALAQRLPQGLEKPGKIHKWKGGGNGPSRRSKSPLKKYPRQAFPEPPTFRSRSPSVTVKFQAWSTPVNREFRLSVQPRR
jgi:hypothetical protein